MRDEHFDEIKLRTVSALDKSPKGSIDEPLLPLLDLLNADQDYVSTSCCSGRIAVYLPAIDSSEHDPEEVEADPDEKAVKVVNGKGGGRWLFVSHEAIQVPTIESVTAFLLGQDASIVDELSGEGSQLRCVYLKFEPVVRKRTALPKVPRC